MYRFNLWYVWSIREALPPAIASLIAFIYGLCILAYPPPRRFKKLSVLLLVLPVGFAFTRQADLTPDRTANDTFCRFLYIWLAHMSYEVILLEFTPTAVEVKENVQLGWRERFRQAYKVLFDRNHAQVHDDKSAVLREEETEKHGWSKKKFLLYHAVKVVVLFFIQEAWYDWTNYTNHHPVGREIAWNPRMRFFFRRIFDDPSSLNPIELYFRAERACDWVIINMFLYESYHSFFAVLFVGILQWDSQDEWTLALCGPLSEAWSVRRYWGKHWHNYIYHSFSSHTKIITRGWLGLQRGEMSTRLLENTLVFLFSGLGHSLVRWQEHPNSDYWAICLWYVGQMVPIIIEHIVQALWRKARKRMGISPENERVNTLEKTVGYLWVAGWFMWSVPKYIFTRELWGKAKRKAARRAEREAREAARQEKDNKMTKNDTN